MSSAVAEYPQLVLGPELNGIAMTPEEFDAVEDYDDNYCYELIHGVLVVNSIPLETEVGPNEMLGYLLLDYKYRHAQGSTLDATLPGRYIRTKDSRRRADRIIYAGLGRMPDWRRETPTIAVEFVSAGRRNARRDYDEKRREYMAIRIAEYWLIDRFRRILTVFRREGRKVIELVTKEGDTYTTTLLPGFELSLGTLLEVADSMRVVEPAEEPSNGRRKRRRGS